MSLDFNIIKKELKVIEKKLFYFTLKTEKIIPNLRKYTLNGGKRVRPSLLLLSYKVLSAFNKNSNLKYALNFATMVEMIHTASLLHDDVLEGANLRRGKQTLNNALGNKIAILVGDFWGILATSLITDIKNHELQKEILKIVSRTMTRICEGEILDVMNCFNMKIDEEAYLNIVRKKTAALFSASCRIGALLANASRKETLAFSSYGKNLGIAFQIKDDILDYTSSAKKMGKPVLFDLKEGKITLPVISALKNAGAKDRAKIKSIISDIKQGKTKRFVKFKGILIKYGCIESAYKESEKYIAKAKKDIALIPDNKFKKNLNEIADFVIKRKY